MKEHSWNYNAL